MPQKTNNFERFWKELKRRKTGKVIVAYAATAFILLQLADILTPALLLPEWTTRLVTLLLIIGFPVAVIFSWVFDITPEGIKKTGAIEESESKVIIGKPAGRILTASNILIAALIIVVAILAYPKIFSQNRLEKQWSSSERISVAVMPFQNMTNDTTWNVWQNGIQINLINSLSNNREELKVRQSESITSLINSKGLTNYASLTPTLARTISRKLDANIFINGSINQSGSTIRLNSQLVDAINGDVLRSFQIDGTAQDILTLIDSLSVMLKNFLIISELGKELPSYSRKYVNTSSPEAFRYFIYGRNYFFKLDYPAARNWFSQAISVDSGFYDAITMLSLAYRNEYEYEVATTSYGNDSLYDQAKKWCIKAYEIRDQMPIQEKVQINWIYASYFETPYEVIKYLKQIQDLDDQNPTAYFNIGNSYYDLYQYDKAITEYEKALEIFRKWESKPNWSLDYIYLGNAYHKTGKYEDEQKLYEKAEQDFPNDPNLIYNQVVLLLTLGDTIMEKQYVEKGISIMKSLSMSEASIAATSASIYADAGLMDKAEDYYRRALLLEPQSAVRLNALAYLLIDKNRNISEGMELVDKALVLSPDDYNYLHTKGWGLYKQGKYKEALDVLQKSWKFRKEKAVYDHEAFLHLETAKKAVAGMK